METIPLTNSPLVSRFGAPGGTRGGSRARLLAAAAAAVVVVFAAFGAFAPSSSSALAPPTLGSALANPPVALADATTVGVPTGVNLGSWLSLEDYFFSGRDGEWVNTRHGDYAGACLPPLRVGMERWRSETELYSTMVQSDGRATADAAFEAFRNQFVDRSPSPHSDLGLIKKLGMEKLRVPVTWCQVSGDDPLEPTYCQDPYQDGLQWPALSRKFLAEFLRDAADHGLKVTLDLHVYPGGGSTGTFSGVTPHWPLFWYNDDPAHKDSDAGRKILRQFVEWLEGLQESDPHAFKGLGGLTPMNEPAHLAGSASNPTSAAGESFLPPLPPDVHYHPAPRKLVPDGAHMRVLQWLDDAVVTFRESSLPAAGVLLYLNVHESIFSDLVETPGFEDTGGLTGVSLTVVVNWWKSVTTVAERAAWAVLDNHHYYSWDGKCDGASDGSGSYTCGDRAGLRETLGRCARWAGSFRAAVDEPTAKLASSEFAVGTHCNSRLACDDLDSLQTTYQIQLQEAKKANVELYAWSWKMPYSKVHRSGWSLKHLLYLLGAHGQPDEARFACYARDEDMQFHEF